MRTRYLKVLRDLGTEYAKNFMLVLAIAIGVFGIGTILGTYAVLNREMSDNYTSTRPASATLVFEENISAGLVDSVRQFPGIHAAERRATPSARMKIGDRWYHILLFVIDDFDRMEISRFHPVSGARNPAPGCMLVERTALTVMQAQEGDSITIRLNDNKPVRLAIVGTVHDPGLAPAWQEEAGYAYLSMATFKLLGKTAGFDLLRVEVSGNKLSADQITQKMEALAAWLGQAGHPVHEIQVPPPGQHPHQSQMNAVLSIFTLFSFMILILGSILVATAMATLMVKQVRHIGVMKTIGATSWQIGKLYLLMMLVICALALAIGMPLSQMAATAFCVQMSQLLNLEIGDSTTPLWVLLTQCGSGIMIPLLAAAVPVVRGSRMPVRRALDNQDIAGKGQRVSALGMLLSRISLLTDIHKLALRNAFRQRARLILTLALLAAGGAIFMTAINVSQAWDKNLERLYVQRLYDQQVQLNARIYADTLLRKIDDLPGVKAVEGWDYAPTSVVKNSPYAITRTYPDKGHGSFAIQALPLPTQLLNPTITEGHWLSTAGSRDVVLNQLARKPGMKIGDSIRLMIDTQTTTWTIVGFTEDVGSPATAYVSLETFARQNDSPGKIRTLRIAYEDRSRGSALHHNQVVEQFLEHEKIGISSSAPVWQLRNAVAAHMRVLINALLAMAVLMGVVGTLGLTSTMSMNVLERTREIGVMRAIGATPKKIRRLIAWEGVTIGALSLFAAFALALPLSYSLGRFIGYISFKTTLALTVSASALGGWAVIVIAGSYLATVFPARKANKITTRQALAYE